MEQKELQIMFRRNELEQRAKRRQRLMLELLSLNKRLANEGILASELLTPEERLAHDAAIERIKAQELRFNKEITITRGSVGYWRRLWKALTGF